MCYVYILLRNLELSVLSEAIHSMS